MLQRWRHRRRCRKLAHACPQPILQSYLESCAGLDIGRIDETPLIAADLRRRMGIPNAEEGAPTSTMVIGTVDEPLALVVDSVGDVVEVGKTLSGFGLGVKIGF